MGAPQYEQAGADVAGSGTTNTIPRWNPGPSTLGDSILTQSGNNIGVGEPSPAGRLQVQGLSGNNTITAIGSTTTGQSYGIFVQAGTNASDRSFGVYNTSLSPYLLVRGDGNVGINTASPGDRLQIGAPTGTSPFGIIIGESYVAASQRARLAFGDANRGIGLTSGDNVLIHTFSSNSIVFGHGTTTSFTERARIDSNGNVVINTAAIATNATNGFLYVPSCAGTPTGTPTTYTGRVPIVVDTTNNKLYFYSGGAWRDAGP